MLEFNSKPIAYLHREGLEIPSFILNIGKENIDWETVDSFGSEWNKFNSFSEKEITTIGDQYFDILEEGILNKESIVLDVGCGSGRWSMYVSSKAGFIEAIDPSEAVYQAARLLKNKNNVRVSQASVDTIPFKDNSFDMVFSLGVLHHIPDTFDAIKKCVTKLKPGGYFLVYLYYNLDNRGGLFKALFFCSNLLRRIISRMPQSLKSVICDFLAIFLYLPIVLLSRILKKFSFTKRFIKHIPLSYYADKTFKVIRNDSLDRFGTPLEQRFSKKEIKEMMEKAGLTEIKFSESEPYWHAIGKKK